MAPWIRVDGDINAKHSLAIVHLSEEATRLSEADAQQVTREATDGYPECAWKHVPIMGFPDFFVVEAFQKRK